MYIVKKNGRMVYTNAKNITSYVEKKQIDHTYYMGHKVNKNHQIVGGIDPKVA